MPSERSAAQHTHMRAHTPNTARMHVRACSRHKASHCDEVQLRALQLNRLHHASTGRVQVSTGRHHLSSAAVLLLLEHTALLQKEVTGRAQLTGQEVGSPQQRPTPRQTGS